MKTEPYAVRDAAFEEWLATFPPLDNLATRITLQNAFEAGWKARKAAAYMTAAYGGDGLRIGTEPEDDWMKS